MSPVAFPPEMEGYAQTPNPSQNRPTNIHQVEVIEIDSDDSDDVNNEQSEEEDEELSDADEEDESEEDEDEEDEEEDENDEEYEEEELTDEEANGAEESESAEEDEEEQEPSGLAPELKGSIDVQQAMRPLRRTADRVTMQIEAFAQNLNQFKRRSRGPNDRETYNEACELVRRYHKMTQDSLLELNKVIRSPVKGRQSTSNSGRKDRQVRDAEDGEELRKRELETETWDLLLQLLSTDDPESRQLSKQAQDTVLQSLHRYSSDREVWEGFLEADNFAKECVTVLRWLEKTARRSTRDIDDHISELETNADRGQGLWAHGWLYTKEAIKGAKRLRSWPQPLVPDDPGIATSLIGSEDKQPLITQLDPDAVTRQKLGLQKQDEQFEHATWLTCWKMLRIGQSWSRIRDWSQERLESWRAVSVCGAIDDTELSASHSVESPLVRMMNFRSQASWRLACSNLANNPKAGKYERAVYALLAGETEPAFAACQGWTDYLYVLYNHLIITRYNDFCKRFHRKLSYAPGSKATVTIDPPSYDTIFNFLENLKKNERTAIESRNPFRSIQAAILSRSYDSFFARMSQAAAKAAIEKKSKIIPPSPMGYVDEADLAAAKDDVAVRVIAHLFILAKSLGYIRLDTNFLLVVTTNVVTYIELLNSEGTQELIPLYASFLPKKATHLVLAKILVDVVAHNERARQVKVIKGLGIDFAAVLESQWQWYLAEANTKEDFSRPIKLKRSIVKQTDGPGKINAIKKNLVGTSIRPMDETLIRCLHWHRYLEGHWATTCSRGTQLYKRFIEGGRLASARELWKRVKPSDLAVNIEALEFDEEEDLLNDAISESGADSTRPDSQLDAKRRMALQMHTMRELEQLIAAFDALETWANLYDDYLNNPNRRTKEIKKQMQEYIDKVTEAVEPVCGHFLMQPVDDVENHELEFIRSTYLPEVVFAYHAALFFSGKTLGREIFAQCMTLATKVAQSPSLINSFMRSNRMSELVDLFAISSIALLSGKEAKLKKRLPDNANMDVWLVRPVEGDDAMLNLDME